ncbi:ribosome-associated translation inhibitor RaiA [Brachybacterium sp. EF45031]|uniref:ribosome hibernation-promoting factor, HPF/YfiA family n=1 Tax=Brachybacterium sillae TaxID=2810536 RepID=UPI00217ED945|nr:ribosome-associated translation inhibitor RaiA [Brachybacterium sillae]MCS6711008.1 ribosome-associated translation inhibitor RaiA [Brachybacterium sillae]
MEISVVGRHLDVPERFRRHLDEKLEKVAQLSPETARIEVEISHENNPRRADEADRVELTFRDGRSVIRSEARADDLYAALDLAYAKLVERLRRARDRRKDHRRGRDRAHLGKDAATVRTMPGEDLDPALLTDAVPAEPAPADAAGDDADDGTAPVAELPVVIREKTHRARPMSIDDALYEMEAVGHDFYLFIDQDTHRPKVVYRRKGWNYGVIELEEESA